MTRIYILLFIVMASWGFNVAALATLVREIDPMTMTAFRVMTAGVMVLILSKFMGIFRLPTKDEWKTILLISLFSVVLHHTFMAIGLTKTTGVNAGIILGAAPLVTMVLSMIFMKNHVSNLRILGFIAGFVGIIFTSLAGVGGISAISIGDGYVFLCMVAQAISFILIGKLNPTFDPRLLTGYILISGSLIIFILGMLVEQDIAQLGKLFSPKLGSIFLFSSIIATAVGHMIYNYAVKNVGPAETTIFVNLNTMFALIGSALFLGEPILRDHFIGLGLIVVGVFAGSGTMEYLINKKRARN